jgi:hypothetical protein
MKKVLFVVTSDPLRSSRPAEAVRVAAGVGAWKKVEVTLYLRGAAVLALGEFTDDLVDEDHFQRYLPIIKEWGRPVLVEQGTASLQSLGEISIPFQEVSDAALASQATLHDSVLRF